MTNEYEFAKTDDSHRRHDTEDALVVPPPGSATPGWLKLTRK